MYFNFACPQCSKNLRVKEELAGRLARCPHCKNQVRIPEPTPPEPAGLPPLNSGGGFDLASLDFNAPAGGGFDPLAAPGPAASLPAAKPLGTMQPGGSLQPGSLSPAPVTQQAAKAATRPPKKKSSSSDDGTNVDLVWTAAIGLLFTVIFYAILAPIPKNYFRDLFFARGWVTVAEAYLMYWSITILLFKWRKFSKQQSSMLFDLLPESIGKDITQENLPQFAKNVQDIPVDPGASFLIRRVMRGLEHYSVRGSSGEVGTMLSSQSELDNAAVASSYSLLNVFIWAIPILGFIGTVQGLGDAVGGLSSSLEGASDVESIKKSLGGITGGLGVAFDTTLVALIMSLCLKFPASWLQKKEEDLLNWVEEYCNENLLKRLQDVGNEPATSSDAALQKAITAALAPHHAELRSWSAKLGEIGKRLTDEISQGWIGMQTDLQGKQAERLTELATAMSSLGELTQRVASTTDAIQSLQAQQANHFTANATALETQTQQIEQQAAEHTARIEAKLTEFAENSRQIVMQVAQHAAQTQQQIAQQAGAASEQIAGSLQQSTQSLERNFQLLQQAVSNLNVVLGELNGKQVVIETAAPKRKGWFG